MKKLSPILWVFVLVAIAGLLDTSYLAYKHYAQDPLACSLIEGCDRVTNSAYSQVYGIPLAFIGVIFYAIMIILALLYAGIRRKDIAILLSLGASAGFLASVYFVYLQIYVIQAICIYCMISAVTATLLFFTSLMLLTKNYVFDTKEKLG